ALTLHALTRYALLLALQIIEACQCSKHNVEGIIKRQVPENPLSQALQKHPAKSEENAYADSAQGIRCARPQKNGPHLKPAQPKQCKQDQARDSQLAQRQRAKTVGWRGLGLID